MTGGVDSLEQFNLNPIHHQQKRKGQIYIIHQCDNLASFQQFGNSPEIMFYFGVVVITGGYYKGLYCKLRGNFNFIYITEEINCENDIFIDYEGN